MEILIGYAGIIASISCILLINKHIAGLPGYGFFYPLMVGSLFANPSISSEWIRLTIFATTIGWIIYNFIRQHVHLLLYPRHSLYLVTSLIVFIIISFFYIEFTYQRILHASEIHTILLTFIVITTSMLRIYNEGKGVLSLRWRMHILYFLGLSGLVNILINSNSLMIFFQNYRQITIVIITITISLGFYTGLQVKEMIRFRKLIRAKITQKGQRKKQ